MRGVVRAFDAHAGRGELEADDGSRYPFHCTAIADGSREVASGTAVEFEIAPGLPGSWEATAITPA